MNLGLGMGLGFGQHAPAFTPKSVGGNVLWLRADLGVTLTSSKVSAWADQSGSGDANKNMGQATAARRPTQTLANAAFNGHATIDFNAASTQWMNSGVWSTPMPNPATWMWILKGTAAVSLISTGDDVSNVHRQYLLGLSNKTADIGEVGDVAGGNIVDAAAIVIGVFNGASSKLYVSQATPTTGDVQATNTLTALLLGIQSDHSSSAYTGSIAEIAGFNLALGATDVGKINAYASQRYGITIGA